MLDPILYTLMGFTTGTIFGGMAALSLHKARFGEKTPVIPDTKSSPAGVKGMSWRERARKFDIPFKRLVQSGVESGVLEVSGYRERFVLEFKCQHPDENVDSDWVVLPAGLLEPRVDIFRAKKTYTYSEFLALGLEGEDPMELVRSGVESHRAIQEVNQALAQLEVWLQENTKEGQDQGSDL